MRPIRSDARQRGMTLVEMMIVLVLGVVVMMSAGAIYTGVNKSFSQGAKKVVGGSGATQLSTVLSRHVRVASGFMVYDAGDRSRELLVGNSLALLDGDDNVTYRLEWDANNTTLADSTGARLTAMDLQSLRFWADPVAPNTVRFAYRTINDTSYLVDIESAVALRN